MSEKRPLADEIRPLTLDEVVGQKHLLGKGALLRRLIESGSSANMIFYGPSGTGKTTSVRAIVALFERMGLNVLLAAPTGRAAKRMGELCDRDAQTIHRMLGMTFNDQTGEVTFTKGEKEPLEADALIVDETSMVDLSLMRALLAALRPGCRLVLVGDPDQLPSVGAGNVFSDLIRSGRIATVALRDIFRQAEQSMIVRNAHLVNTGMPPKLNAVTSNRYLHNNYHPFPSTRMSVSASWTTD